MKIFSLFIDQKGMALMTTMMLGLISIAMITGIYFAMTNSTRTRGINERYVRELEIARGVADYIRAGIFKDMVDESGGIKCCTSPTNCSTNATDCTTGSRIQIPFLAAIGRTGNDVNATFLSYTADVASVRVVSRNTTTNEHAIIDFVMSIE